MAVRQLTVSHIILMKFDINSERCTIEISFKEDTPFLYSFTLSQDFYGIVERLIADLKRAKASFPGARDDDILAGYNPVYLLNLEDLEERLPKGLAKIFGDVRSFRQMSDATAFMQARASLESERKVLFRSS